MNKDTIRELALVSANGEPVSSQLNNSLIMMAWTPFLEKFAHNVIERFCYDSDQYLTNDATREAAIAKAIADELDKLASMDSVDRDDVYLRGRADQFRKKK